MRFATYSLLLTLLLLSAAAATAFIPVQTSGRISESIAPTAQPHDSSRCCCCCCSALSASSSNNQESSSSTSSAETEVERLLRKARELRAAAEQEEQTVHHSLTRKKAERNAQTDRLIDGLFFASSDATSSLVDRLRRKQLSMDTLEAIVDRLDEREVIARGLDHVEFEMVGKDQTEFRRVSQDTDQVEEEIERLEGLIDQLVQAAAVLDEEFLAGKKAKGGQAVVVAHAEEDHWGGGKRAQLLESRIKEIRRERSEQYQKRMDEFREAQRRKDDDDHKFKGYTDLGNLN